MHPSNQQTLMKDPGGGSAPESFEELAKSLNNHPKSVAVATLAPHSGTDWKEALEVSKKASVKDKGMAAQQQA